MSVLHIPSYRRLFVINATSTFGSQLAYIAIPLAVLAETGSPAITGVLTTVGAASRFVSGFVAGVVVDRSDAQSVMRAASMVAALSTGALAFGLFVGSWVVPLMALAIVFEGAAAVFFAPAEDVAIRYIVPQGQLPAAYSWSESATWVAAVVGPILGAVLFGWAPLAPFAANSASYVVALLLLVPALNMGGRGRSEAPKKTLGVDEVVEGFRLLWNDGLLRFVALQVPLHNMALGALTLVTFVKLEPRSGGNEQIGVVFTAAAVAALAGTSRSAHLVRRFGPGKITIVNGAIWCLGVPVIIATDDFVELALAFGILWLLVPSQRAAVATYMVSEIPDGALGRTRSAYGVLIQLSAMCGPAVGAIIVGWPLLRTQLLLMCLTVGPVLVSVLFGRIWRYGPSVRQLC